MAANALRTWVTEEYEPFIALYQEYLDSLNTANRDGDGPVLGPPPPPPPPPAPEDEEG